MRERDLRTAASGNKPAAVRELACYLYNAYGQAPGNLPEAVILMN